MSSLPFRTQGFQKDNLSCVIMSICDLGQALVMHECIYRQTQGCMQHTGPPFQGRHNKSIVGYALLLLTVPKLLSADVNVYSRYQGACSSHSSLTAHSQATYVLKMAQTAEGHTKCILARVQNSEAL